MPALKGEQLRIEVGSTGSQRGTVIALATSCTVHVSASSEDSSTKDDYRPNSGVWQQNTITSMSWDVTSDSFMGSAQHALMAAMLSGQKVKVSFGTVSSGEDATLSQITLSGEAYVTDVNVTATNKQNATCSATLTGTGPLNQGTAPAQGS